MPISALRLTTISLPVLVALAAGCQKRSVVSNAEASVSPAAQAPPTPALADEDEDEGGKKQKSGKGANRWKQVGVYLDGQPMGLLRFGELPIALKPTFLEEKVSAEKEPGSNDPGYRIVKSRRYKFVDYVRAIGVDPKRVKEIHVYGPRFSETIIATGKQLASKQGEGFMFRFGAVFGGKPLPVVSENFGNGRTPDKISAVMIYVNKKPPKLVWNEGLKLDGKVVRDVPYYGPPLKAGARVYSDDKLAVNIRRDVLADVAPAATSPQGAPRWKLWSVLEAQGVDTSKVVEAWIIRDEHRREKLSRAELEALFFEAPGMAGPGGGAGQGGGAGAQTILVGDKKLVAEAIALHSRPIGDDELPRALPDEEDFE